MIEPRTFNTVCMNMEIVFPCQCNNITIGITMHPVDLEMQSNGNISLMCPFVRAYISSICSICSICSRAWTSSKPTSYTLIPMYFQTPVLCCDPLHGEWEEVWPCTNRGQGICLADVTPQRAITCQLITANTHMIQTHCHAWSLSRDNPTHTGL